MILILLDILLCVAFVDKNTCTKYKGQPAQTQALDHSLGHNLDHYLEHGLGSHIDCILDIVPDHNLGRDLKIQCVTVILIYLF